MSEHLQSCLTAKRVTIQTQEGAVLTDDEMLHYVAFALSGNLSGFLIISLVKSTSIAGQ